MKNRDRKVTIGSIILLVCLSFQTFQAHAQAEKKNWTSKLPKLAY